MKRRWERARSWSGIWMVALLLLAACVNHRTVSVRETTTVEAVQTLPIATATRAVSLTPSPTSTVGENPIPSQVLPDSLAWDPSGHRLAYASNDGRIWLHEREAEMARSPEGIEAFAQSELRAVWSPDGENLLVYGEWGSEHPRWTGLWLVPIADNDIGPARPIVAPLRSRSPVEQNSGAITSASWSPDGKHVAYAFQAEAWAYSLDGGQSQQVTVLAEQPLARSGAMEPFDGVREVSWSPNGRSLALGLSCNCPSPWSGVGIVDVTSQETRLLVDGGQSVSWSPDGRWITFQNASGDWTGGSTFDFYGVDPESHEITNLTRSNPGWDPLRPMEGVYQDAHYQTAGFRWGQRGRFLFEALDYSAPGNVAPQWGFVVKDSPEAVVEALFGDPKIWYAFPAWLADGRYAYFEVDAAASTSNAFAIHRAVVGLETTPTERVYVRGAAWAPDGSAVALCVADGSESPPNKVTILALSLTPIAETKATRTVEPTPVGARPQPLASMPLPTGFAFHARDGTGLLLCSLEQQATANVDVPTMSSMMHIAGGVPEGRLTVPVVYFDGEQQALRLVSGGSTSTLVRVTNLMALVGAPGQPVLAYTALEYKDQGLVSHLYVGTLQSLVDAAPALSVTSPESYALHPLAVHAEDGQPAGVWYTYAPYGIGGDIVFPPRSGLYYLDLSTGASLELLGREIRPSSVSLDQAWIAFVSAPVGPLTIRQLTTGKETVLPLLPDSDRGAGRAVFAPGSRYVAWMEGRGSMWADPSTFRATVRIASTSGDGVVDIPAAEIPDWALSGIAGTDDMWLVPVGWLDEKTVLLQVVFHSPERSALLRANYDGTGLEYLAPGILAGLLYPEE